MFVISACRGFPGTYSPSKQVACRIGIEHGGQICRVDDDRTLRFQGFNGFFEQRELSRVESSPRVSRAGHGVGLNETRPRDADSGATQAAGVKVCGVVAVARRVTSTGGRIVRVWFGALKHPEENGGIGDAPRHRSCRVLVRSDRNDPVAADASQRRLDADQHVLVRGPQDGSGGLRSHVGRPQVRAGADARARATR